MPSGTRPQQRDIWLVPLPFSDLRSTKRRPVIVLSHHAYHVESPDCLVMAITSNTSAPHRFCSPLATNDLETGTLPKPSLVRTDKIFALQQTLLIHYFGRVSLEKYMHILQTLGTLVHPAHR